MAYITPPLANRASLEVAAMAKVPEHLEGERERMIQRAQGRQQVTVRGKLVAMIDGMGKVRTDCGKTEVVLMKDCELLPESIKPSKDDPNQMKMFADDANIPATTSDDAIARDVQ